MQNSAKFCKKANGRLFNKNGNLSLIITVISMACALVQLLIDETDNFFKFQLINSDGFYDHIVHCGKQRTLSPFHIDVDHVTQKNSHIRKKFFVS